MNLIVLLLCSTMIKHYEITACEIDLNALSDCLTRIEERLIKLESLSRIDVGSNSNEQLLTRNEVARYFKVNISTVRNWTKQGILTKYGVGDRVYYKKNEVEAVLVKL